jgi:predicted alpha/beta-hydrolase family hydrolase
MALVSRAVATKPATDIETTRVRIAVEGSGEVSAVLARPSGRRTRPETGFVVAHGAGNDMEAALVVAVAEGLARRGHLTLRFNFPYKEAGRKPPDRMPVLERAYRAAIARLRGERPARVVLAGKSMGGRVASMLAAEGEPSDGLVFLGYPLHAAGKKTALRDAHLPAITAPMLFLEGTRDPHCDLDLLRPVLAKLGPRATLHVIDDGDHSLDVPKRAGRTREDVQAEVLTTIDAWARALAPRP